MAKVESEWVGKLVRRSTETLDVAPSRRVEYVSEEFEHCTAWAGEHVTAPTLALLDRRLRALAQPVRTSGRLSFGRYEVR
jgi:hypothetical protein